MERSRKADKIFDGNIKENQEKSVMEKSAMEKSMKIGRNLQ